MGVTTYSSAIFNFLPEWALSFYDLVRQRDRDAVYKELREFVLPTSRSATASVAKPCRS